MYYSESTLAFKYQVSTENGMEVEWGLTAVKQLASKYMYICLQSTEESVVLGIDCIE